MKMSFDMIPRMVGLDRPGWLQGGGGASDLGPSSRCITGLSVFALKYRVENYYDALSR